MRKTYAAHAVAIARIGTERVEHEPNLEKKQIMLGARPFNMSILWNGLLRSAVSSAVTHNVPGVRIREPNSQVCPSSEVLQCPCVAARAHCVDREMVAIGRRQTMYKRRSFVLPEAVRIAL